MINVYFMNVFLASFCMLSPMITYNFDKQIAANLYVRLVHSVGCIYYIIPILYENNFTIIDTDNEPIPENVIFVLDRTIKFFLWDCIALLISNEEEKPLFIAHHLISVISISFSRYYGYNWYLMCIALFLGEVTNPLTQVTEFCKLINYQNSPIEKTYFQLMVLIRGICCPITICLYYYNLISKYRYILHQSSLYQLSILINIITMNLITITSVTWIHKKYLILYKNNNDKKVS